MKSFNPVKTVGQWLGSVDEGRQLELLAVDENGEISKNHTYPLLSFFKEEKNEELYLEFSTDKGLVQISAKEIRKALDTAEKEVHSEEWYEENVYKKMEAEQDGGEE